ncbi:RNA polymerase I-associated factor PAF67-domain-containing protein [Dimargaris cristalligena]|uniref:Eukaryotic translation initiation factor 3 subunit L n=1 Tax=Dimargaris cristalligena TaxID=215637 RepID=A0A4P9ZLC7_9FUNG|nr:RNA polymerase I-associated factor PAF67-domain-containing protein [Dimargaris cristalligena]|eukprot:RKP34077.1 RNA polymerase I-associated factor PAF67-domain-containing protein [Dimargaris cristalligena]
MYKDPKAVGDAPVNETPYQNEEADDVQSNVDSEEYFDDNESQTIEIHIPDQIRNFLSNFQRHVRENNAYELHQIYESQFNRLTDRFYAKQSWPDPIYVGSILNDDGIFLTLYRELYYRHIYARLNPTVEDRFHSYENYCDLFNYILNSEGPVDLDLPNQWLWDIVDEFIYQFQAFCTYRNQYKRKHEAELYLLKENPQMWSCYSVLNVLYSLIQKSNITEQLLVAKNGGDLVAAAGDYGSRPTYKMLGYFSIIGLLRVHCLLGDYTMALKMMDNIEMNSKAIYTRVTACYVTTYYYVGFAYMMMRRYADAIRTFSHILVFVSRTKQYHSRAYHYQMLTKTSAKMYALLALCVSLCPTRLDENIHNHLREKYGEQQHKMHRGGEEALRTFEDLFLYACPKFITPSQFQATVFLSEARYQILIPTLRSYLKMYSAMGMEKLAAFLEIEDVQHLRHQMLLFKLRSRQKKWVEGTLLEGEYAPSSDLDFYLRQDMIHIAESKVGRRYADWFIRNINKLDDIMVNLQNSKAASPPRKMGEPGTYVYYLVLIPPGYAVLQ